MEQEVLPGNDDNEEATPPPVPPEIIARIASCLEEMNKCIDEAPLSTVSVHELKLIHGYIHTLILSYTHTHTHTHTGSTCPQDLPHASGMFL